MIIIIIIIIGLIALVHSGNPFVKAYIYKFSSRKIAEVERLGTRESVGPF